MSSYPSDRTLPSSSYATSLDQLAENTLIDIDPHSFSSGSKTPNTSKVLAVSDGSATPATPSVDSSEKEEGEVENIVTMLSQHSNTSFEDEPGPKPEFEAGSPAEESVEGPSNSKDDVGGAMSKKRTKVAVPISDRKMRRRSSVKYTY